MGQEQRCSCLKTFFGVNTMTDSLGLYLHIPFCKSKCPYCDFFSGKGSETDYVAYCAELKNKIYYWSKRTDRPASTVYFGGGTPSILGTERLCDLLQYVKTCFSVDLHAEITLEVNPDSGRHLDFSALKEAGFNRVSVGFQTAAERELKALGRIHSIDDARLTVRRAQDAGIDNLSMDLMMGIPFQTIDSLKSSIDFCASLGVKHISSYLLKIEKGTRFYEQRDSLHVADDDEQADLYLFAVDYLESIGYRQYEISNVAFEGFESCHNSAYWQCREYIGIGPSAHSFFEGKRFFYGRSMQDFIANILHDDGDGGSEEEYLMLALRLKSGLRFSDYRARFQKEVSPLLLRKVNKYVGSGLMERDLQHFGLTARGFLVSNTIISDLLS